MKLDDPPDVSLTATGVVCALGLGTDALWRGLLAGESRVGPCDVEGERLVAAPAPLPTPEGEDRTDALVREAARQLTASPAWASVEPARLGVCLGTTQGPIASWSQDQRTLATHRPATPSLATPTSNLARLLGARGPVACPSMACASSTAAIGLGLDWIRDGACDAVVAGGADALSGLVHAGFSCLKALDPERPRPFDRRRAGLAVGEGAALVLLQRGRVEGAPLLAGWAQSADANHLTGPDPEGRGVARAIERALAEAGLAPADVGFISAHGTATDFNDLMESKAFIRVFGEQAARIPVNSIKGAIGHTMGAAGAIEAVLCVLVLRHGVIPPTAGLEVVDPQIPLDVVRGAPRRAEVRTAVSTSSGFGGVNAAIVLRAR